MAVETSKARRTTVAQTDWGFSWGNAKIERHVAHHGHRVLAITTERMRLLVRITPSGLIRIQEHG